MIDKRFFKNTGPFTIGDIVKNITDMGFVYNSEKSSVVISDISTLSKANAEDISFFENKKYLNLLKQTKAGAVVVSSRYAQFVPEGVVSIVSEEPYKAFAKIMSLFYSQVTELHEISPLAKVSVKAKIGDNVSIGDFTVIEDDVTIGDNVIIGPNCFIGRSCTIGNNTIIDSSVNIRFADLGKRCIIHSGTCVGQDGFGFAMSGKGHFKIPQLGTVIIGDDVELGSNVTIDRGAMDSTIIGEGTKIDNLVQIGHNVKLGKHCILVSQVGIAGSSVIGDFCIFGGQSGAVGHINIADGSTFAARSGVISDVKESFKVWGGFPAIPNREYLKIQAKLRQLISKDK